LGGRERRPTPIFVGKLVGGRKREGNYTVFKKKSRIVGERSWSKISYSPSLTICRPGRKISGGRYLFPKEKNHLQPPRGGGTTYGPSAGS